MDHDEGARRAAVPMIIDALAMQSPHVRAALHRHLRDGEALVPLLRDAHARLLREATELMQVAGAAPFADTPDWPEGESDDGTVTQEQLLAIEGVLQ